MLRLFEKLITAILLVTILGVIAFFIVYPNIPKLLLVRNSLNLYTVSSNSTINLFTKLNQVQLNSQSEKQGNPETIEYITPTAIEEHLSNGYRISKVEPLNTQLAISSVSINGGVVDGEDSTAMDRGFWFYPLSVGIGTRGNSVIIGHRFLYIPPRTDTFFNLDKVKIGDKIIVTQQDNSFSYTVIQTTVVDKNDTSVLKNTKDYRITLITCTPLWTSDQRLVIIGKLDKVYGNI